MKRLIKLDAKIVIILYIIINILCVGAGMSVPIFCILLEFPIGWYITKRKSISTEHSHLIYHKILKLSLLILAFTFLQMIVIWGRTIPILSNPASNFENFGYPFILFDPKLSLWVG
jgi:hypothetical protein